MLSLGNLFPIYLNVLMTKKFLNLDVIDKDLEHKIILKINQINVPSILNCSYLIKKQFFIVIFPLNRDLNKISIYIFKKTYDFINQKYIFNQGICKKNFVLDFIKNTEDNKNWLKIINNNVSLEDIYINFLEEHNIKSEDFLSYRSLYYSTKNKDFQINDIWGEETSVLNIDWILTVESIIKKYYGCERNLDIPNYKTFKKSSINKIYYPYCLNICPLYKYITQTCIFKCDNCIKFFDKNQNEKDIWHNSNFGDLCNLCYQDLKNKYFEKIYKNWKFVLLLARKILFKKELENTIRFLHQKKFEKINFNKKILLYENIIRTINKDSNRGHCSICLDVMNDNISSGTCGHCFHTKCIEMIEGVKCPVCRTKTKFFKLHL
tara:strand:- start:5 stop:1138 length:1134 start_codon:yes stop_codon:yes gene_type:complete